MDTHVHIQSDSRVTQPWNKGKLTGAKPPLSPKHVWAVRTRLQLLRRFRDLALFNLAIDSKLRGCDLVGLRIADVAPHDYAVDRASVRQLKTGRPVRFEVTEQTRQAIDDLDDHLTGEDALPTVASLLGAEGVRAEASGRLKAARRALSPALGDWALLDASVELLAGRLMVRP